MDLDISKQIFIDHHAHVMRRDFQELDEIGLRQAFSESRSVAVLEQHMPYSVSYINFLANIEELLHVNGESALLRMRETFSAGDYVNLLFDDVLDRRICSR